MDIDYYYYYSRDRCEYQNGFGRHILRSAHVRRVSNIRSSVFCDGNVSDFRISTNATNEENVLAANLGNIDKKKKNSRMFYPTNNN